MRFLLTFLLVLATLYLHVFAFPLNDTSFLAHVLEDDPDDAELIRTHDYSNDTSFLAHALEDDPDDAELIRTHDYSNEINLDGLPCGRQGETTCVSWNPYVMLYCNGSRYLEVSCRGSSCDIARNAC